MASGFSVEGNTTANVAEVDGYSNLKITLPTVSNQAGFAKIASEVDPGAVVGYRTVLSSETSRDYRLRTSLDTELFTEIFSNTTLNSSLWTAPVTSDAVTCASGFCKVNSSNTATANGVARLQSYRYFPVIYGTHFQFVMGLTTVPPPANTVTEWGAGICTGTSAPTDGAFFRINLAGEFRCVLNYNGTEIVSPRLNLSSLLATNTIHNTIVSIFNDTVTFWIDDVKVAVLSKQQGAPTLTSSGALPLFARTYQGTVAPNTGQCILIGQASVTVADTTTGKHYGHIKAGNGLMAYQVPSNNGATFGQTQQLAVSTNPSAANMTKTTAALGTGLGGVFLANTVNISLSQADGYVVASYQVPAGTKAVQGRTLYITGAVADTKIQGAASNANPLTWAFFLGFGATQADGFNGASLGVDTATTKAARYVCLGTQSLASNAVIGTQASPTVIANFQEGPIMVQQGEFVQVLMRCIAMGVAPSQVFWIYITLFGYWE